MSLTLDLNYRQSRYRYGDINVYMTWNMETTRPCLVLVPRRPRTTRDSVIPYVVALDTCWQWFPPPVGDAEWTLNRAIDAAANLGFNVTDKTVIFRVIDAVQDNLDELISMPALSLVAAGEKKKVGEAIITERNSGQQTYQEIKQHV